MKKSNTFRRRSKRSKRSRKTNKKRYTRGGETKQGVIDHDLEANSISPGPEWWFRFSCSTAKFPLYRVGGNTEEKIVKRRDDKGWDLYARHI